MKYPRIKKGQDRRKRLSDKEIALIKSLDVKGLSFWRISLMTKHTYITIRSHLDPKFKKRQYAWVTKSILKRYHNDSEFKNRVNENRRRNMAIRRDTDPVFRQYNREKALAWMRKNNAS